MPIRENIVHESDVLVIGGGASGCMAALKAKEFADSRVIQLDKGHVGRSGAAAFADGTIHAFYPEEDDYDQAFKVEVEKAGYIVDQDRLRFHLETGWAAVEEMARFGVEVQRTEDGKIRRFPSGGFIKLVIAESHQMMETLANEACRRGVEQFNKIMMTDLLTKDGRVVGATAFDIVNGEWHIFKAGATIITGSTCYKGINPGGRNNSGDGQAAAYRAGSDITNLELTQGVMNSAHYDLISGMFGYIANGARLLNDKGERFMEKYYPELKEKVPVSSMISTVGIELRLGNGPIYLDMTHLTPEQVQNLKRVLPLPMQQHEQVGNFVGDKFVKTMQQTVQCPRQRIGGPLVNIRFETCLPGLYAIGDAVPWAGDDGGKLIGAFTAGIRAGKCAAEFAKELGNVGLSQEQVQSLRERAFKPLESKDGIEPDKVLLALQEAFFPHDVLLVREEGRMKNALKRIEDIRDNLVPILHAYDPHYLRMALEIINLVTLAEMTLRAALFRKESRAGGLREDYPYTDSVNWLKWVSVKQEDSQMKVFTQDIPIDKYPLKPPREKVIDPVWQAASDAGRIDIKEGRIIWA